MATELVTNAVRHAGTSCRLSLRLDDAALRVAVRDHRPADTTTLERLRSAAATARGLGIVAAFSQTHGVTQHSDGKTVWAHIALHRAP